LPPVLRGVARLLLQTVPYGQLASPDSINHNYIHRSKLLLRYADSGRGTRAASAILALYGSFDRRPASPPPSQR
jgi:hypothetical protein